MWQARFYQSLPKIVADYPDGRWMFLTLTVVTAPLKIWRNTYRHECGISANEGAEGI
jgi:hypothetical protein